MADKNVPTILIGSGATIELGAPSTNQITKDIIKPNTFQNYANKNYLSADKKSYFTAVLKVYERLKVSYPEEPNFEHIFHILEMLYSYDTVWIGNCKNPDIFPLFSPFVVPQTGIIEHNEWQWLFSLISQCQLHIMQMVNKYDENYKNKKDSDYVWYKDFWQKFNGFNLFNLNYDTTIENSIGTFNDGFVDSGDNKFQKFNPNKLYEDDKPHKICHLHGCILFYNQRYENINHDVYEYGNYDMYKWQTFKEVESMMNGSGGSNQHTQSGETIYIGPIITGLRKTDKLTAAPYNYYHHFLNDSILKNKSLLIVGYSFGDLYINDLIERMNLLYGQEKRIVVITKLQYDTVYRTFCDLDATMNNVRDLLFVKKMMHDDNFEFSHLDNTITKENPYESKDKTVQLYVYGFKSAVEKHSDRIINFLKS